MFFIILWNIAESKIDGPYAEKSTAVGKAMDPNEFPEFDNRGIAEIPVEVLVQNNQPL